MKGFSRILTALSALLLSLPTFAVTIYLTETDLSGTVYKVNTDTATFQTFDVSPQESPGAIAVLGNRIVMSDYDTNDSWAYDLNFNPTGESWSGAGSFSQALDGTTDGVHNNSVWWSTGGVVQYDLNFQGGSLLFDPGFPVIGITYDSATGTLWLVNDSNHDIYNYSLAGTPLGSFSTGLSGRLCCLAYDPETNTLWLSENSGTTFYQFSKLGALLDSVTIPGFTPSNTWGAEIGGAGAAPAGAVAVPSGSFWSLLALAMLLLAFGSVRLRRASN
jgi:hypothetical protein